MPESDEYVCTLSDEMVNRAKEELNEDPVRRDQDLQVLRDWLSKQPHIKARTDAAFLLRYLRGCKFSLEKTKTKLETYYTCKGALPNFFKGRDSKDQTLKKILNLGLMVPLPGYDFLGRRVILGRLGVWDPNTMKPEDLFKAGSMLLDVLFMEDEQISVTGFVQLHDMEGFTIKHVSAFTLPLVKSFMTTWTEGYPIRPKGVHYINTPSAFDAIYTLFKRFMKEKMKKRIKFHGSNIKELYSHIPKEILPQEYGGNAGTVKQLNDEWVRKIEAKRNWFLEDEQYKVDESKRVGKSKTASDLYGTGGSFRKLDLD